MFPIVSPSSPSFSCVSYLCSSHTPGRLSPPVVDIASSQVSSPNLDRPTRCFSPPWFTCGCDTSSETPGKSRHKSNNTITHVSLLLVSCLAVEGPAARGVLWNTLADATQAARSNLLAHVRRACRQLNTHGKSPETKAGISGHVMLTGGRSGAQVSAWQMCQPWSPATSRRRRKTKRTTIRYGTGTRTTRTGANAASRGRASRGRPPRPSAAQTTAGHSARRRGPRRTYRPSRPTARRPAPRRATRTTSQPAPPATPPSGSAALSALLASG